MNIVTANNLTCPIDGEILQQHDKQLVCSNGHSFDIARQGYVNLLPVQHKRSKQPGDSKAMVVARTNFLNSGVYQKIANKLIESVSKHILNDKDCCILDAGCGEGYYFDYLINGLDITKGSGTLSMIGLDISKDAVLQAAKRNKQISWVVGTNRQPPVEAESVDIVICMFGFFSAKGFSRILKPGGMVILVDPGSDHLKQLREIIYSEVKESGKEDLSLAEIAGYSLLITEQLQYRMSLTNNEQVNHLLLMTPHFFRASKAGRQAACELDEIDLTVDVVFRLLQKNL